ncbi:hypothetical protein ACWC4A_53765 [Streptomyces mirabilis]
MTGPLEETPLPTDDGIPPYPTPSWWTTTPSGDGTSTGITAPPEEPGCHVCQARPVAYTEIRSHTGLIFWGRTSTVAEPLCGQCGIALVRTMTARTLWQGWWGLLSLLFHTPVALVQNAYAYRQFRALPLSAPPPGRSSIAPGKPLLRRPQAYVALIPAVWAAVLITRIATR